MRRPWAALAVLLLVLAAGCGTDGPAAQPAAGVEVRAATTLYPFAWLAEQVAPEAEVVQLAEAGAADAHDVQLSPAELQTLLSADVVVHVGEIGYQPQVERSLGDARGTVIAAIDHVDPLPLTSPHDHDDQAEEDGPDPHIWHSPAAMAAVAAELARVLAGIDPDRADDYRANAERVIAELEALEAEANAALSDCRLDEVVVSHPGYTYLLTPRGIAQEAITGGEGHGEPSPQRLSALAREIREHGHPAVVAEPVEGRAAAESLARETGVELGEVLPLGTVTPEEAARGYPALVRANVAVFARALSCPGAE